MDNQDNGLHQSIFNKYRTPIIIIGTEVVILIILMVVLIVRRNTGGTEVDATPTPDATASVTPGGEPSVTGGTTVTPGAASGTPTPSASAEEPSATPVLTPTLTPEEEERLRLEEEERLKREEEERKRLEEEAEKHKQAVKACIDKADLLIKQYNYDKAIEVLKNFDNYEEENDICAMIDLAVWYKGQCVAYDNNKISHIFFHSLIYDPKLAFGDDSGSAEGYNLYMTTVNEFKAICQQMYDNGFVLVSISDVAKVTVDGSGNQVVEMNDIMLPEGKTPFVMSQDDVNYYDYMEGEGFATKIVLTEDGKLACEYIDEYGVSHIGSYDLVPILNDFIAEHPDFSYRGAKAILAVTGYEGLLGYETTSYRYYDGECEELYNLSESEKQTMLSSEREQCAKVIEALKADGWEFASHSYGHGHMSTITYENFVRDTEKWLTEVGSLLGEVNTYIFPYGEDICSWQGYSGERYEYLKSKGFIYYCNVDSLEYYWVQQTSEYLRMGRIDCDGLVMIQYPERVKIFFDADLIIDDARPPLLYYR